MILKALKIQSRERLDQRRPMLIKGLENMNDFYLELKWDFHSWGESAFYCILVSEICFLQMVFVYISSVINVSEVLYGYVLPISFGVLY